MAESNSTGRLSIASLILVPAIITLAVTVLRLAGELEHWSKALYNSDAGGPWSIIGITWLAPVFGLYFGLKLARAGEGPASSWRAMGVAVLGWVIMFASQFVGSRFVFPHGFEAGLIFFWVALSLAGLLQIAAWPELFKVLLAYGYAARVPVAVVMFLAFMGRWGTHYDALPPGWVSKGLWGDFIWLGFFPQMTLWVGYTLVAGMLFGSVAAAVARALRHAPQPA